jgi:hypothetical protein
MRRRSEIYCREGNLLATPDQVDDRAGSTMSEDRDADCVYVEVTLKV